MLLRKDRQVMPFLFVSPGFDGEPETKTIYTVPIAHKTFGESSRAALSTDLCPRAGQSGLRRSSIGSVPGRASPVVANWVLSARFAPSPRRAARLPGAEI